MVAIVACDKKCISPVNVSALPYKAITMLMNSYIGAGTTSEQLTL